MTSLQAEAISEIQNEARILAELNHPGIIKSHNFFVDPSTQNHCLILDYALHQDLSTLISQGRKPFRLTL
jgi:serine/threonine protein kinase